MTRSFTIATSGQTSPRRWWWVRIYPTVEQLRAAATRSSPGTDFGQAYGVCHTARWWTETGLRYGKRGYAGVIRLAQPHLTGEIVGHELLHAAVAVYRMTINPDVRVGRACGPREEALAYLFGELYSSFATAMENQ